MSINCNGSSACEVVVTWLVPIAGSITTIGIYASTFMEVRGAVRRKSLGQINPLVFPLMSANSLAWVLYGYLIRNLFVCGPALFGHLLSLYYYSMILPLCSENDVRRATYILIFCESFLFIPGIFAFIHLGPEHGASHWLLGGFCVSVLVVFYGSPLSVMYTVVKTKSSSNLSFPLAVANLVNGGLWGIYGFVIMDWFVGVPNLVGAMLSMLQLVFLLVFPRRPLDPLHLEPGVAEINVVTKLDDAPATAKESIARGSPLKSQLPWEVPDEEKASELSSLTVVHSSENSQSPYHRGSGSADEWPAELVLEK